MEKANPAVLDSSTYGLPIADRVQHGLLCGRSGAARDVALAARLAAPPLMYRCDHEGGPAIACVQRFVMSR